ncbi:MAG: trehalose synthase [Candidatus Liptonbacteria bacterium]|nr:trehalose synthase [Candidatus Liptonbacteria bacterium]
MNNWWGRAVFYELYVDKFAGNFRGIIEKLPYLKKLGIGCVHILPHYPSPMIDDGYDISDYFGVRKELGTLDDFKNFIAKAHELNIRVMVDFVLNHVSVDHHWFIEARNSADNPQRDLFLWSKSGKELRGAINPFIDIKPSNWIYNKETNDYYFSTFYPQQADLNWDNPEVFEKTMGVIDFWANIGVDAFRLDAVSHLIKREGTNSKGLPETHAMLRKIRSHVENRWPEHVLLAEAHEPIQKLKEYFGAGDESHMVYNFPLAEKMILALKRSDPDLLQEIVQASLDIPKNCSWAVFLRNHDDLSLATLKPEEHKEIFNYFDPEYKLRFGDGISLRLANFFNNDPQKIIEAFELLFSLPGSQVIYYGDEIGMGNLPLTPGIKDTRLTVRAEMNWKLAEAEMNNPNSIFTAVAKLAHDKIAKSM